MLMLDNPTGEGEEIKMCESFCSIRNSSTNPSLKKEFPNLHKPIMLNYKIHYKHVTHKQSGYMKNRHNKSLWTYRRIDRYD